MVRPAHVGRSRGCQPCRRRRIKCDLTHPKCLRCLESDRDCPGPLTGVLFIQAEHTPSGKMRGKLLPSANSRPRRLPPAPDQDRFSLNRLPSQADLAEDNLLSGFLEFFSRAARRSSWTLKLPQLKTEPDAYALRSSLRAVSLAYFAHVTHDHGAQIESLRHYGQSLARQRSALTSLPSLYQLYPQNRDTANIDVAAATNALLATVVLSYFELISPSGVAQHSPSPNAWINHTLAAERLVAMLGSQALSNDIIGQLFFSIRSHAVHRAAVLGHYTVFSEKEWLEAAAKYVPKQSYARSAYDRVTELILKLTRLRWKRSGTNTPSFPGLTPDGLTDDEEDTPESLLNDLKHRYMVFLQRCRKIDHEELPLFIFKSKSTSSLSRPTQTSTFHPRSTDILLQSHPSPTNCATVGVVAEGPADLGDLHPRLQKAFAAMTTAYFHAAVILFYHYFPEVARNASKVARMNESGDQSGQWAGGASTVRACVAPAGEETGVTRESRDGTEDLLGDQRWDTLHNANIIVTTSRYLSPEGKSNGTAVLRMMLPFSVIWHFCGGDVVTAAHGRRGEWKRRRDSEQVRESEKTRAVRLEARRVFEDWCLREGMGV